MECFWAMTQASNGLESSHVAFGVSTVSFSCCGKCSGSGGWGHLFWAQAVRQAKMIRLGGDCRPLPFHTVRRAGSKMCETLKP